MKTCLKNTIKIKYNKNYKHFDNLVMLDLENNA